MNNKRLYIFDLDGVLVNTSAIHTKALRQAVRELVGDKAAMEPYLDASDGKSTRDKLELLDWEYTFDRDAVDARKKVLTLRELDNIERSPLADYLPTLIQHGKLFALASNSRREFVDKIVERLGLKGYFHVTIAGDEITNHKPHPEIFERVMEEMGMYPCQTVVFEDSPAGIAAATAARVDRVVKIDPYYLLQPKDFLL